VATTLSIVASNAAQLEGNSGSKAFTFTVNRAGDLSGASSVQWRVAGVGSNPANAADFLNGVLPSGTVAFAAGENSKIISVYLNGDTEIENDEEFNVIIYSATGATISTPTATGTIRSDDLPSISLSLGQASVAEDGSNNLAYIFSRTGPTNSPLTINYIVRGTTDSSDYTGVPAGSIKPIAIAAGASSATLAVDPTAETLVEDDETIEITLSPGSSYAITTPAAVVGKIINDDTNLAITPPTISQPEGDSGKAFYTFTVTRTGLLSGSSTAQWSVTGIGGQPADTNDFPGGTLPTGTVTFAAGETSQTITIEVNGDTIAENDETFAVTLANPTGATITSATANGMIVNDDTNLAITPPTISQPEGNSGITHYTFTVTRTGLLSGSSTAQWSVAGIGGQPADANDFPGGVLPTGSVTFAAGETSQTITIDVNGDTIAENNETFAVTLTDPIGATITTASAEGVIINDDTNLGVIAINADQIEGNNGSKAFTFAIQRTGILSGTSTTSWAAVGSGVNPADASDFAGGNPPSGTVTFAPGESSKLISIDINGDTQIEIDETFSVTLYDSSEVTPQNPTATGTIISDEPITISLGVQPSNMAEDGGQILSYIFTRSGPTDAPLTINFLISGSADPSTDYTANCDLSNFPLGIITFNAGDSTATLDISPTTDATIEGDETIEIELLASSDYAVGTVGPVVATIINDDVSAAILAITSTDATKAEGNSGITVYTFTVNRSGNTSGSSTATWAVSSTQATGDDFVGGVLPSGTVSFAAGDTSKMITVEVNGDSNIENDESFAVSLSAPAGATITTASADGTIINDDYLPSLAITSTDATKAEGNSGTTVYTFTVNRSGNISGSSTAEWAVSSTQASGDDFVGGVLPSGTVSFAAGDISKTISVWVNGESHLEADESFSVTLANPTGATITTASADGSIINDDAASTWTQLLGSGSYDFATALTSDSDGSVYISGITEGNLDGQINSGGYFDAFISKFNPDGSKAWTQLLGSASYDYATALTSGSDGSIYIGGYTYGNLDGQTNSGYYDTFISKFNPDGSKAWTQLLGTGTDDFATALTSGSDGSIYIGGYTAGNLDGQTNSGGGYDAFISKFNPDGSKAWTQLLGSASYDYATALTSGSDGSIYIGGGTDGNLDGQTNSGGGADAFISKFNPDGSKAWTQLLGSGSNDYDFATALTSGSDGSIYIGGGTDGNLDGQTNSGEYDAFISKFNPDGSKAWIQLLGSGSYDFAYALTSGSDGSIYIGGLTNGNLDGQTNSGNWDAFISKFNPDGTGHTSLAITATDATKEEGNSGSTTYTFTVNRSGNTSGSSTAEWAVSSTQASGDDFVGSVLPSGIVTFAAGEASKTIIVEVNGDSNIENDETFSIALSDPAGAIITTASADGTIINDDYLPSLAIIATDATKAEGNSGSATYTFTVNRSGNTSGGSTAQWAVSSAQATGNDFVGGVLPSGTVTFAAGDTSKAITIEVNGDGNIENNESFTITLTKPAGATIINSMTEGTIINDDVAFTWTRLLGSSTHDIAYALTTGSDGSIYVGGSTDGNLDGQTTSGSYDAFISKLNPNGSKAWTRRMGSKSHAEARALTTGSDGSIYIGGGTYGNLDGQINSGNGDAFISKFNPDGSKVWTQLLGSNAFDYAYALTTGSDGSIYICGYTEGSLNGLTNSGGGDAFISKFNPDGSNVWTRLLGSNDFVAASALAIDSDGSIYIGGYTQGNLDGQTNSGSYDAFISKLNPNGSKAWTSLLGSNAFVAASALASDSDGSIYIGGYTQGNLDGQTNSGGYDAFISKFNSNGSKVWSQLLGTSTNDYAWDLTTGSDGSIYIGGYTYGNLDGQINSGEVDAFISKLNPDGSKAWTQLLGSNSFDGASALTTGSDGSIYIGGYTQGNLDGQTNSGGHDAFISKLNPNGIGHTYLAIIATDAIQAEGNGGSTSYTFTVARSGNTSGSTTATWAVSSSQATGDDFVGRVFPSGTVTFATGDSSKTIIVEVNGDSNIENDEIFAVSLSDPAGATINTATVYGAILDDDVPVPCLSAGTLIRTPSGNRPVEELQIGDLVLTPNGPQPLKFLGISTRHINNLRATGRMPIRIQAGVMGHNLPSADIYCTPSHAFALGDCLVEAQALINGQSIYQLEELSEYDQRRQIEPHSPLAEQKEADSFTYYSLEFEQHVLVWANDMLTESYLPTYRDGELTRVAWNNYDNYLSLYESSETMEELPMPRIPFSRQIPLRIREQFGLDSIYGPSTSGANREELCLTL
jgi:uncharacterized delta-60 repeat protein